MVLRRVSLTFTLVLCLCGLARPADLPDLDQKEEELLAELDTSAVSEILEVVAQVEGWRKDLETLRQQVKDATEPPDPAAVQRIVEALVKRSAAFKKLVGFRDTVNQRLREWQNKALSVEARARAAKALIEEELTQVLDLVEKAKNPAKFAGDFLETELKKKFFNKPYEVSDEIEFRLEQQEFRNSLFSPKANVGVVMVYNGGMEVKATGLYFKYRRGKLPEPQFDKIKVTTNLSDFTRNPLKQLGDFIPDLGIGGIKLRDIRAEGFEKADGNGRRGGISFQVDLDLPVAALPGLKFAPKGRVTVYTTKPHVVARDLELEVTDDRLTILIPGTPLQLQGYTITFRPKDKEKMFSVKTSVAPQGAGKETVALELTITFGIPVRKVEFKGLLVAAGGQKLGEVKGSLSGDGIEGHLKIPPEGGTSLPFDKILKAEGSFRFDREGIFIEKSFAELFTVVKTEFELTLRFDGSGRFYVSRSVEMFGLDVSASLEAKFEEKFRNLQLTVNLMANVEISGFRSVGAAIKAVATVEGVDVEAKVLGLDTIELHLDGLDDDLLDKLQDKLKKRSAEAVKKLLKGAKELDVFNKNSALRKTLVEFDVFNENSEAAEIGRKIDEALNPFRKDSRIREGLRDLDPTVNEDHIVNKVFPGLFSSDFRERKWDMAASEPGTPDPVYFPFGPGPRRAGGVETFGSPFLALSVTGMMADEIDGDDELSRGLRKLVRAVNRNKMERSPEPTIYKSGTRRFREQTELRLRFDQAAVAPERETDAVLAFAVYGSGFLSKINTDGGKGNKRKTGSEMKWGDMEFRNLWGERSGEPTARINVPSLKADYTSLPAEDLALDRLQNLVEKYLPGVAIEGRARHYEKKLLIDNRCEEPITVWVQRRTRVPSDDDFDWVWKPGGPGVGQTMKFTIPARSRKFLEVEHEVSRGGGTFNGKPVDLGKVKVTKQYTASRVRLWAESASGERWTEYRDEDLWLVDENPLFGGRRRYYADIAETYTHVIRPGKESGPWSERMLTLANETDDKLNVNMKYRTLKDGVASWFALPPITLRPGERLEPHRPDNLRVRASAISFSAEGENFLFDAYKDKPLWTIEEKDGQRLYLGKKIGSYTHTFRSGK